VLTTTVRSTDTRYGRMAYYAGDAYIGRSLELYGEYSPGEIELMRKIIKPGWTVVNGGANIGALTVPMAQLVGPSGKIYAFEPQPETFQLLKRNTLKKWRNVTISDYALWHQRGDNKMRYLAELQHDNFGCTALNDGTADVRMIALDDWLQGEDINLIFLDIEGSEIMALEGAKETIKRCRPVLYVEDHPDRRDGETSDVVRYIRSQDYLAYEHKPDMYSEDNWKKNPNNVFTEIRQVPAKPYKTLSFNILCIPPERVEEFRGVIEDQPIYLDDRGKSANQLRMIVPRAPGYVSWAGFCRCGGVGDNLIAASVARPLKEMGYNVEVITQEPQCVVFENNPFIDKISVRHAEDWPKDLTQWQEWFRGRSTEYARFANLGHSCEALKAAFPIMTAFWWPQEFRRKMFAGSYIEAAHDILGLPHTFGPLFFPTREEREQARLTKKKIGRGPIIGWCIAGTRIDKIYPHSPLAISRLISELNAQVVMMGAPPPHHDAAIAKDIMEVVKSHNGSTAGLTHAGSPSMEEQTWPIRRICTLAQECDLMIGPDTGPMWAVAFEPVPKIVLISHASVENITSHWINTVTLHADPSKVTCWPCHRLHDNFSTCRPNHLNNGAACISDISVDTIVTQAMAILAKQYVPKFYAPPKPRGVAYVE